MATTQQVLERWKRGVATSAASYKEGIQNVRSSPMEKAAAKKEKYLAGVQAAVSDGSYEAGLRAVTLEEWKQAASTKGAERLASGAAAAAPKMQKFLDQFLPFVETVKQQIDAMPDTTMEERLAKMVANARALAQFRFRPRG